MKPAKVKHGKDDYLRNGEAELSLKQIHYPVVLHRILETMIFYLRSNKDVVDIQLDVLNGLGAINR